MDKTNKAERIWEIDFLRGVSIILMVGYHLLYDLGDFAGVPRFLGFTTDMSTTAWAVAQSFFASVFVVLSGICATLTRSNVRRGIRLLAISLLVTAATHPLVLRLILGREVEFETIWFGILQCLAVSMLLYGAVFKKAGAAVCAAWGAAVLALGAFMPAIKKALAVRFDWLLPFGLPGPAFSSYDYFPLIPWFGVFLIGAALGKSVYASRRSLLPWRFPVTFVNFAGRYSLWIYLAHQPIIMGLLYLIGLAR